MTLGDAVCWGAGGGDFPVQGRSRDQEGPNLKWSPVHCEKFKKSKMSN